MGTVQPMLMQVPSVFGITAGRIGEGWRLEGLLSSGVGLIW